MSSTVGALQSFKPTASSPILQTIAAHYKRLLTIWPKDPLRPNLPFQKAIEHRAARFAPSTAQKTDAARINSTTAPDASSAGPLDARQELRNINALYSLLDNRYSKLHPTSPAMLKPRGNPEYYDKLLADIKEAPNRSWLKAKWENMKMKVRWK
jgi:cytochrome b pre-mRNA-processing protein 6